MTKIIITVPDDMRTDRIVDYVQLVANQIEHGYLSGHVTVDHHWSSDGRLS